MEGPILVDAEEEKQLSINLMPYVIDILEAKKSIAAIALLCSAVGFGVASILPAKYTAQVAFIPSGNFGLRANSLPDSSASAVGRSMLLGQVHSPSDIYTGVIASRAVLDYMASRFNLKQVYKEPSLETVEKILKNRTTVDPGTVDTIIHIKVIDHSPVLARDLANGYLDALSYVSSSVSLSSAAQRRTFYEGQLAQEKDALSNAEVELKKIQEQTGVITPTGQATLQIETIGRTRAEVAAREVQIAALRQSSTENNPDVLRLKSEIADLHRQLSFLENGSAGAGNLPTSKVPEVALEQVRRERDVKYHEALFGILSRQLEAARMDEVYAGTPFQILDHASTPERKSSPSKALFTLLGLAIGVLLGILWVLLSGHARSLSNWWKLNTRREPAS